MQKEKHGECQLTPICIWREGQKEEIFNVFGLNNDDYFRVRSVKKKIPKLRPPQNKTPLGVSSKGSKNKTQILFFGGVLHQNTARFWKPQKKKELNKTQKKVQNKDKSTKKILLETLGPEENQEAHCTEAKGTRQGMRTHVRAKKRI